MMFIGTRFSNLYTVFLCFMQSTLVQQGPGTVTNLGCLSTPTLTQGVLAFLAGCSVDLVAVYVCLLLQYLLQSCSRGEREIVEMSFFVLAKEK
jgi:hypothetical protein